MTIAYDFEESPFNTQTQNPPTELPTGEAHKPVHVKVTDTQSQRVAAEFTAMNSFTISQAGVTQATQIVPHKYHRYKAKFIWTIPASTTVFVSNRQDPLNNPNPPSTIFQLVNGQNMPDYDGQQPLYAVFTGSGPVTVSVMDETYGPVQ